jgi:hypothetical protein
MNENKEIYNIVENFIKNDYKFGYSFDFKNTYEDIINYWNKWYINNQEDMIIKLLNANIDLDVNLNSKIQDELNIIFGAHFNSSDNHMILFYIAHSNNVLIKIKAINMRGKFNVPYWTLKLSNNKILEVMKVHNIKKNQISVLVYN